MSFHSEPHSEEATLALVEVFCSLQGEGTRAGLPCVFIRLAGCNLRCRWCDTRYAYRPVMERIPAAVAEMAGQWPPVRLVQITGGEPMLQKGVYPLMERLLEAEFTVLLETNGSLSLERVPEAVVRVMDIKCPGSGEEDSLLDANLKLLQPGRDELKFVLADRADYEFARRFLSRVPPGLECLFSPAFGLLDPTELAEWILADRLPARLHLQLHKLLWSPDARGV